MTKVCKGDGSVTKDCKFQASYKVSYYLILMLTYVCMCAESTFAWGHQLSSLFQALKGSH